MARKDFETYGINQNAHNPGTEYESVPYGYTVSPTCPPDEGADYGMNQTMAPEGDIFGGFNAPGMGGAGVGGGAFQPTQPLEAADESKQEEIGSTVIADAMTVGEEKVRPVVGWLVGTKGSCKGRDFRLHSERNYVGRGQNLDVVLNDTKISREPAVQIVFDARSCTFHVAPGERSVNNSYCNNELLLIPRQLKAFDRIQLGDSELLFMPLCGDSFKWDDAEA